MIRKGTGDRWESDAAAAMIVANQFVAAVNAFEELYDMVASGELRDGEFVSRFNEAQSLGIAAKQVLAEFLPTLATLQPNDAFFFKHLGFYTSAPNCLRRIELAFDLYRMALALMTSQFAALGAERFTLIEKATDIAFKVTNSNLEVLHDLSQSANVDLETVNAQVVTLQRDHDIELVPAFEEVKALLSDE